MLLYKLLQLIFFISTRYYKHNSSKPKKILESLLLIASEILLSLYIFKTYSPENITALDREVTSLLQNKYFIATMYHKNQGFDKHRMCENLENETKIVLLPNGNVSVAQLINKKEKSSAQWEFKIAKCESPTKDIYTHPKSNEN
nr:hypothetical protein [uncultured Halomonas sp.]